MKKSVPSWFTPGSNRFASMDIEDIRALCDKNNWEHPDWLKPLSA